MRRRSERGSASLELVIVTPVILALFALLIMGGRVAIAGGTVNQIAYDAARAATLSRTTAEASQAIDAMVASGLAANGITCAGGAGVTSNLGAFSLPVGQPGPVTVNITCQVPLADIAVLGIPGAVTVSGQGTEILDAYRGRN